MARGPLFILFICVCVFMSVCMCTCAHGSLATPEVFPNHSLLMFLGRALTEPGAQWSARLGTHQTLGILPSLVMAVGPAFYVGAGVHTRVLYGLIFLPSLVSLWLKNLCPFGPGSHYADSVYTDSAQLSLSRKVSLFRFVLSCLHYGDSGSLYHPG